MNMSLYKALRGVSLIREFRDIKPWRRYTLKPLSGHSQMRTAPYVRSRHLLITHRCRFDRVRIRSRLLNRRLQGFRKLVWE